MTDPADREGVVTTRMLKYEITSAHPGVLMCEGAIIRAVGTQHQSFFLWAETPAGDFTITRRFHVIGTGEDVPAPGIYLGTVFDKSWVWHVYEVTK